MFPRRTNRIGCHLEKLVLRAHSGDGSCHLLATKGGARSPGRALIGASRWSASACSAMRCATSSIPSCARGSEGAVRFSPGPPVRPCGRRRLSAPRNSARAPRPTPPRRSGERLLRRQVVRRRREHASLERRKQLLATADDAPEQQRRQYGELVAHGFGDAPRMLSNGGCGRGPDE
jgi:hypothetical protein